MTTKFRSNRKATDHDIIRLNSVGMSLRGIARMLGCNPSTITLRLKSLNVPPADTRRTFMEDIFTDLTVTQQDWIADQLGPHLSIKDFVRNLLVQRFIESQESKGQP